MIGTFIVMLALVHHPSCIVRTRHLPGLASFDTTRIAEIMGRLPNGLGAFHFAEPIDALEDIADLVAPILARCRHAAEAARVMQRPWLRFMPAFLRERLFVRPQRFGAGGTLLACRLAIQYGIAVNLSGGYHHASMAVGDSFCLIPDIALAIHALRRAGAVRRVLVVDVDAHQGNGVARDFGADPDVRIVDLYNEILEPADEVARRLIDVPVPLSADIRDDVYLAKLEGALEKVLPGFAPDLAILNAGTDVLAGDPLGRMHILSETVVRREAIVAMLLRRSKVPLAILLSGGYGPKNADTVSGALIRMNADLGLA